MRAPRKWLGWAALVAVGLGLFSASDADGFRRYFRLRRDIAQLADRNAKLTEQNDKLVGEIELLRKDPRAVERAAREELGYVKPGEVIFSLEAP